MKYLTIQEAVKRSGKADKTIRRLVERLVRDETKTKRGLVRQTTKGKAKFWEISEEALDSEYPKIGQSTEDVQDTDQSKTKTNNGQIITILEEQLKVKDQQIRELHVLLNQKEQALQRLLPEPKNETLDLQPLTVKQNKMWWQRLFS